jgi:ribosomal protein S18 acetylase RimI-like enzyme
MSGRDPARDGITLVRLDIATLERHLAQIVALARDVPHEYWREEHFRTQRPRKFELSRLALRSAVPQGYAIVSEREPGWVHLHHLMVGAECRGHGVGGALVQSAIAQSRDVGARKMTLKVAQDNIGAIEFYRREGFAECDREGSYLWLAKAIAAP